MCKSKAPFNPILGETYQASLEDGTMVYIEQTEHHPPSFNYSLYRPDKHFEINGYGTIEANLEGMNMIKGERIGKNVLKFADGSS